MRVPGRHATAIVGPNGAGKTTYFNLISGQLPASAGRVLLAGKDITRSRRPHAPAWALAAPSSSPTSFRNLSVHENVRLAVQAKDGGGGNITSRWSARRDWIDRADRYLAATDLKDKRDVIAVALPHGDKRKLEVAILMALEPDVFMFDEPTAGMSVGRRTGDPRPDQDAEGRGNKTILLVEHKMEVVRSLADRIIVLNNGRLVADGAPSEVIGSAIVQEAYLGIAAGSGSHV